MNRSRLLMAIVACMALLVSACGAQVDDSAGETAPAEDPAAVDDAADDAADDTGGDTDAAAEGGGDVPTISFVSFTNDITEMAGQQLLGLEERFEEAGFEAEVTTAAPAGAEDHEGMDRILQDVATIAPDYVIVNPSSYALVEDRLLEIQEAGTTVIVGNIDPAGLEEPAELEPLTWVAVDEYAMGYNGAEYMATQYCEEGAEDLQVVPFYGPAASEISQNRVGGALDALEEVLGGCGIEYEIVDEVFSEFDRQRAFDFAERIATAHPDLDLIIGANSNTALGVMESLDAQGRLEDIDILGMGGQLDELAAICRGDINAAGFRDPLQMGFDMAEAVMSHAQGNADDVPEVTLSEIPVTHDCATVFETAPIEMLDLEGFIDNIPPELFEEFAG